MTSPFARYAAACAFAACSFGAHASLVPLSEAWSPGSTGLGEVQFRIGTGTSGLQVALGAHADNKLATLPNNGVDTFFASKGLSPTASSSESRWSLAYAVDYGSASVSDYVTRFWFDTDPTAGTQFSVVNLDASNCGALCGMQMLSNSINASALFGQLLAQGSGFAFDPFADGNFAFRLDVLRADLRTPLATTEINVLAVPEPGSMALAGVALLAALSARRRARTRKSSPDS